MTITSKNTWITEARPEPLYSLVWTGMWIAALAALLMVTTLGS